MPATTTAAQIRQAYLLGLKRADGILNPLRKQCTAYPTAHIQGLESAVQNLCIELEEAKAPPFIERGESLDYIPMHIPEFDGDVIVGCGCDDGERYVAGVWYRGIDLTQLFSQERLESMLGREEVQALDEQAVMEGVA